MEAQESKHRVEYLVKRAGKPSDARILASGSEVGVLKEAPDHTCTLQAESGGRWTLSRKVHGEIRPFSLEAIEHGSEGAKRTLTIRNHLFVHKGRVYMLANSPAGRPLREYLLGRRYICRLDRFPTAKLAEIDRASWGRVRTFRGVPVGEMDGLGTEGHRVKLAVELEDIGLPLAAACYLLYSTA